MKQIIKIILLVIIAAVVLRWLELKDWYRLNYRELSEKEQNIFEWKSDYDEFQDNRNVYAKYFGVEEFMFPRQEVFQIKLLEKDKIFKTFGVSKTLKKDRIKEIVALFNDPLNFDWGETTWGANDVDYILKFYDNNNRLIGKVEMC